MSRGLVRYSSGGWFQAPGPQALDPSSRLVRYASATEWSSSNTRDAPFAMCEHAPHFGRPGNNLGSRPYPATLSGLLSSWPFGNRAWNKNAGVGGSGNQEENVRCSSSICIGSCQSSSVPQFKGTRVRKKREIREENPGETRLKTMKKEEESSVNFFKKNHAKKIHF